MKRVKLLALILLGCIGLYYIVLMFLPMFTPKVNDSDLAFTRRLMTKGDNGFEALATAATNRWWPNDALQELAYLARGTNWDAELAMMVLTNNAEILKAFDESLRAPEFEVPEYRSYDECSYLQTWSFIAQLVAIRAEQAFRDGKEREAFQNALDLVRMGNRMQNAGGPILHYLSGGGVRSAGINAVKRWLPETKLDAGEIISIGVSLRLLCDTSAALTNSLKAEYQVIKNSIADIRAGRDEVYGEAIPLATVHIIPVYNDRRTQAKFAESMRAVIAAIAKPSTEVDFSSYNESKSLLKMLLGGNVVGEMMFHMLAPSLAGGKKCQTNVREDATLCLLGLKAYQLKHGKLPDKLEDLVPEFLPVLPMDDFDGKPLRYLPSEKLLYSVGENHSDDGGIETDSKKHTPDFVFPIQF